MKTRLTLLLISFLLGSNGFASEYYVSKKGNDNNPGSQTAPFLSIQSAASKMLAGDVCLIDEGIYTETVRPQNAGTLDKPIVFKPLSKNANVVISGTNLITSKSWEKASAKLFKSKVELSLKEENQIFLGEKMLLEARWPNCGEDLLTPTLAYMDSTTTEKMIVDDQLPNYDFKGGSVWVHANLYWSNWTSEIEKSEGKSLGIKDRAPYTGKEKHVAQKGAGYYVFGIKDALDSENEWFYDSSAKEIYVYRADGKMPTQDYYFKSRVNALDLSDSKFVNIEGITILAAGIKTNDNTSNLLLDKVKILYPYYRSQNNNQYPGLNTKGVVLYGKNSVIQNSELAYSSGACITLNGENNKLLNSYVHDGNLIGAMMGNVVVEGKGSVVSHCTITRSGRTLVNYGGMYQALIQNCELSYSGMLTSDLGLTYGTNIEGGNSEVRYNLMHHNLGEDKEKSMGLYYDHGTKNIISHHNIIWGVEFSGLLINHYAANHLVYNNTFISQKWGVKSSWGQAYGPDLMNCRFENNAFNMPCETTADNYYWNNNVTDFNKFDEKNPMKGYEKGYGNGVCIEGVTKDKNKPGIGAIEYEGMTFKAGCDLKNPPTSYDFNRSKPMYRNLLQNAAFEHEDNFFPWQAKDRVQGEGVKPIKHAVQFHVKEDVGEGRMGEHSVQLLTANCELFQKVEELQSGSTYEFIAHLRVAGNEQAVLGVRFPDGKEQFSPIIDKGAPRWRKCRLSFTLPKNTTSAEVFVRRLTKNGEWSKVNVDELSLNLK